LFYRYCFSGEKNISIKNKYATDYYVITRKDIYSKDFIDFNVVVESRAEKQAKNSTIFNKMTVLLPFSMPMM
jgi:nicotinic acid phosphoribosyltransferase